MESVKSQSDIEETQSDRCLSGLHDLAYTVFFFFGPSTGDAAGPCRTEQTDNVGTEQNRSEADILVKKVPRTLASH